MTIDAEQLLADLGIPILRATGGEVRGACPAHGERTGKLSSVGDWSISAETGAHHCFSCGFGGDAQSLAQYVLGVSRWDAVQWLFGKNHLRRDPEYIDYNDAKVRKSSRGRAVKTAPKEDQLKVSEAMLALFDDVPTDRLTRRGLDREAADRYGVRWNTQTRRWILPIRAVDGKLLGWQEKGAAGFVKNSPTDVPKRSVLFGSHVFDRGAMAVIVESPLDVVRLWVAGYQGLSTFGATFSVEQVRLLSKLTTDVVLAFDNDAAGDTATRKFVREHQRAFRLRCFSYRYAVAAKDPGEMTLAAIRRGVDDADRSVPKAPERKKAKA